MSQVLFSQSPIRREGVQAASVEAVATLNQSFFQLRFDRLTPAKKRCLRAMAELGPALTAQATSLMRCNAS